MAECGCWTSCRKILLYCPSLGGQRHALACLPCRLPHSAFCVTCPHQVPVPSGPQSSLFPYSVFIVETRSPSQWTTLWPPHLFPHPYLTSDDCGAQSTQGVSSTSPLGVEDQVGQEEGHPRAAAQFLSRASTLPLPALEWPPPCRALQCLGRQSQKQVITEAVAEIEDLGPRQRSDAFSLRVPEQASQGCSI